VGGVTDDVAQERLHRKRALAAALRLFAHERLVEGPTGHMTVRDPSEPELFWVNPAGAYFGHLRAADLLLVDSEGKVLEGRGRCNPTAWAIHSQIQAARPEVQAVVHAHAPHGRAWSALGRLLDPLTEEACAFFEDHALGPAFTGMGFGAQACRELAAALGPRKALILPNHGVITVGGSLEEAAWWFLSFERACQTQLLAEAAGPTKPIDAETARRARRVIGDGRAAAMAFRGCFDMITRLQPELLE